MKGSDIGEKVILLFRELLSIIEFGGINKKNIYSFSGSLNFSLARLAENSLHVKEVKNSFWIIFCIFLYCWGKILFRFFKVHEKILPFRSFVLQIQIFFNKLVVLIRLLFSDFISFIIYP